MKVLKTTMEISKSDYERFMEEVLSTAERLKSGEFMAFNFYHLDEFYAEFEDGYQFKLMFFADIEFSMLVIAPFLVNSDYEEVEEGYLYAVNLPSSTPNEPDTYEFKHQGREYQVEVLIK